MEELFLNLCNPLGGATTAHVLYTVDHPHLSSFSLAINNNITVVHSLVSASFPPGGFFFRGGNSGPHNGTFTGGLAVDVSGGSALRLSRQHHMVHPTLSAGPRR